MKVRLKPIEQQVIVLTGATSGIGLVTAREAARRGARLVLASRSETALQKLSEELGERASCLPVDVGNREDVERLASETIARHGGFDTWINDAAISIYGELERVSIEDHRRLFETNYWGTVYGSLAAVRHLKQRGGALINIGSVLSDRSIPLQGPYCASKHAVKGFTDSLRMELEKEGAPVSVTLIKPSAIDTPYIDHAKNYMTYDPQNPPPVYAPELVMRAILHAAEEPVRDTVVGGGGRLISLLGFLAPKSTDRVMEWTMFRMHDSGRPRKDVPDALHQATYDDLRERGDYDGPVLERSLYSLYHRMPRARRIAALGAGAALLAGSAWARRADGRRRIAARPG